VLSRNERRNRCYYEAYNGTYGATEPQNRTALATPLCETLLDFGYVILHGLLPYQKVTNSRVVLTEREDLIWHY
jgi:hypothetical protein